MKIYNKLVRDRIPEIIRAKGREPILHIADEEEYWRKLKEKLREEVEEFIEAENEEELADMLEVLDAIGRHKRLDWKEVRRILNKKAEERGRFHQRIILDEA